MLHKNFPKNVKIIKVVVNGKNFICSSSSSSSSYWQFCRILIKFKKKNMEKKTSSGNKSWNPTKFIWVKTSQILSNWIMQWWYSTRITHLFFKFIKELAATFDTNKWGHSWTSSSILLLLCLSFSISLFPFIQKA